jgi:hypothetical protein
MLQINLNLILYQIHQIQEKLINQINLIECRPKRNQIDQYNVGVEEINRYYLVKKNKIYGQ